jgi:hypothetical protein
LATLGLKAYVMRTKLLKEETIPAEEE